MSGAILPIYHGAFASLRTPASTLKALKKGKDEEDMEEEDTIIPETLKAEDAYWLPVVGSAVLFSMFLVFKYLDKLWVDRVLGLYFGAVGTFAVSKVSKLLEEVVLSLNFAQGSSSLPSRSGRVFLRSTSILPADKDDQNRRQKKR